MKKTDDKTMKKPLEEQELFLRLSSPNTLRRNILESSKLILTILRQTYKVKQMREMKHERMARLASEIKELRILIQKIDELMPQYNRTDLKKLLPEINFTPLVKKPEPSPFVVNLPRQPAQSAAQAAMPAPVSAPAAAKEGEKSQEETKPETKPKPQPKPVVSPVSEFDKITKALEDVQRKLQNL
jgi:hypothetical protein